MDNFEEEFVKCSPLHLECELFDKNVNKGASSLEMKDRSCRPAMSEKPDVSGYDVILVSFPIWWYRERSIIDSFMESAVFPERPQSRTALPEAAGSVILPRICRRLLLGRRYLTVKDFLRPLLRTN